MRSAAFHLTSVALLLLGITGLFLSGRDKPISEPPSVKMRNITVKPQDNSSTVSEEIAQYTYLTTVYFSIGSNKLSRTQKRKMDSVLSSVKNLESFALILDGYTDSIGSDQIDNDLFAALRSFSVYEYLVKSGMKKENIFLRSYGLKKSKNQTEIGRKVEIFIGKKGHP